MLLQNIYIFVYLSSTHFVLQPSTRTLHWYDATAVNITQPRLTSFPDAFSNALIMSSTEYPWPVPRLKACGHATTNTGNKPVLDCKEFFF